MQNKVWHNNNMFNTGLNQKCNALYWHKFNGKIHMVSPRRQPIAAITYTTYNTAKLPVYGWLALVCLVVLAAI